MVGKLGEHHYNIEHKYQKKTGKDPKMKLEGRIWLDKKYISFYDYPKSKLEFEKTVHDIEKQLKINEDIQIDIWNDPDFKIEIPMSIDEITARKSNIDYNKNKFINLIPLKSYEGDNDINKDRIVRVAHTTPNSKVRNIINKMKWKRLSDEEKKILTKDYDERGTEPYMKWKYAHKNEQIKYFNINKLYETPDNVVLFDGSRVKFHDKDARAFCYFNDKMLIGKSSSESHANLIFKYIHSDDSNYNSLSDVEEEYNADFETYTGISTILKYPGRIWLNKKIISFYTYPENINKLEQIIHDIEYTYNMLYNKSINIWNDDYNIEVILTYDDVVKDYEEYLYYFSADKNLKYLLITIPVKKYKYSENLTDDNVLDIEESQLSIMKYNIVYNRKKRNIIKSTNVSTKNGTELNLKWKYAHKQESIILKNIKPFKLN
jgi:hypothetical protein